MDVRKRRRIFKTTLTIPQFVYTKIVLLIFCLFVLVTLFYRGFASGPFKPTPIVPKLAVFSKSVSNSVQDMVTHQKADFREEEAAELTVENRVVFTDHVLLILSTTAVLRERIIDCVYRKQLILKDTIEEEDSSVIAYPMMSADEYGDDRWIVRCPPPPVNYTTAVELRVKLNDEVAVFDWVVNTNKTVRLWDYLAYEATLDGEDTAVLFIKGLRLKSDRESDSSNFKCHFRNWNSNSSDDSITTSIAITAAQEVIRCRIPPIIKEKLENDVEIEITVERIRLNQIIPSTARLTNQDMKKGSEKTGFKYELCACSMVWNQAAFIQEWIKYHAWLGVQRWFIYDNNSEDNLKDVIDSLNEENNYNVTRHVWPWVKSQEAGFSHCVLRARSECKWVGFFDVDEFYYIPSKKVRKLGNTGRLREIIDDVALKSESIGEIQADCHSFGPSGLKESPKEGVTLGYTCRMKNSERHKSIVRPVAVDDTLMNQVHHFLLKDGFRKTKLSKNKVVINHYKYQVWNVFKSKFHRRVSTFVTDWQEKTNVGSRDRAPGLGTEAIEPLDWHTRFCQVQDTKLKEFVLANLGDPDSGLVPWGSSL